MSKENLFDTCGGIDDYVYGLMFDSIFENKEGTDNEQRAD